MAINHLAKDSFVRAWPILQSTADELAGSGASAATSELLASFPVLSSVNELHVRLALATAIREVAYELSLCPGSPPVRLIPARLRRRLQSVVRPELHDLRGRTWAFAVKYVAGDEAAVQLCHLLFGNWIARQIGIDHHNEDNSELLWEFGRIAIEQGVGIAEHALTQVVGQPAKLAADQ